MQQSYYFRLFIFTFLLSLLGVTFLACGIFDVNAIVQKTENVPQADDIKLKETFTKLRGMFPNTILDEDFKTLKQVINSKVYLDFLKQAYPTDKPFETFEAFMHVAPPSVETFEKYQVFLNEHFENLTMLDFTGIHQYTLLHRRANMMLMCASETGNPRYRRASIQLTSFSGVPDHIRHRLETVDPSSIWAFSLPRKHIRPWRHSRFSEAGYAEKRRFLHFFGKFVTETEKADTDWIQAQFGAHGQAEGLLWIALKKPVLIGEIVTNFPETDLFLKWVEQTFILKRLSTLYQH